MATNSWIGNLLTGGAWGTAGNWSGGVPISTSNIDFNRAWTGDPTISTPNAAIAFTDITAGDTSGGPNQINITSGGASSIWTPVAGAFIDTTLVNQLIQFQPGFAGAVQLAKKGPGLLYASTGTGTPPVTHSGGWDVQGGGLGATVTGRLGTGPVTLAVGTQYGNVGGGAITLANNVTVLGDVYLNAFPAWDGAARQSLTISGSVALPATTATLNVGNTYASPVTLSGAITGTAGFTKAGAGTLTLSAANPLLSGDVSVTASTLATTINVNALQAATLNWTGTVGTFSPLTNSNIGAIKGSTTTNTLALGASAINVGGANTSETFSGKFTGSGLITKNGTGTWTLDGDNSGQTGGFTVGTSGSGTLVAGSATAVGSASAGGVSVVSGSTLQVNAAISKASATLTLAGTGIGGNGALRSLSGTTSYTASGYTITSDVNIGVDAGTMTLGGAGAVMGTGGINKVGAGELVLLGESNTLDRQIVISAGTMTVKKLAPAGTVSSLGRGNTTSAIALTGTLKFDGAGTDSTNRSITFTGAAPVLEATGSGAITYSASTTSAMTGGRLITLTGTSTSANALTSGLADGTGAVSLAKTGAGTWNVTGTLSHTGGTTLSLGTLGALGSTATFAANLNISGGELANGTFTAPVVMTGGTVTATLASTSTLTVNSGSASTLQPTNNANTFSGATTVAAGGILRLITAANPTTAGAGRVLGTSAVSVSGDIKTSSTGVQRGQMRYGGNLTFNTGAKLYVGGA